MFGFVILSVTCSTVLSKYQTEFCLCLTPQTTYLG